MGLFSKCVHARTRGESGCKIIAHKVRLYVLNEMPQIINIYQYITDSTVYIPYKNKIYLLRFLSLILILNANKPFI